MKYLKTFIKRALDSWTISYFVVMAITITILALCIHFKVGA